MQNNDYFNYFRNIIKKHARDKKNVGSHIKEFNEYE